MHSILNSLIAKSASKFRLSAVVLLCGIGLFASLSIFSRADFALGRVPTAVLADADRQVARYGPAVTGSTCAIEGSVSRDSRGSLLMCWKQIWAKP
jgi:hypothetical protein